MSSEVLFANGHFKVSALISSLEMALAIGATLIDIQIRSNLVQQSIFLHDRCVRNRC